MTPKSGVIILLLFLGLAAGAQTVPLQVAVKTAGKDTVSNASIRLFSLPDSTLLQSQVAQPPKNTFAVKPRRLYMVEVSSVSFETVRKSIAVGDKPVSITLGLSAVHRTLENVTIVSRKPLVKQEDDKTIVDATVLANSSTNGYEVLEKTPGIVLDQDGNVYLTSTSPATVYINGREMRMSMQDIASLLKNLPAGNIEKIEIIRTPSARYDASNSGGIVNIVLKKGVKTGTTGSINARYDQGIYGTPSFGASINKSAGKINAYLSYQYTRRRYYEDIESRRRTGLDTLLEQQSSTVYTATTHYVGGGLDFAISPRFSIAYDMRLNATANRNRAISANGFSNATTGADYFKSRTPITNNGNTIFASQGLSVKYKLDSTGSEWATDAEYSYASNPNEQLYTNEYGLPAAPTQYGRGNVLNKNHIVNIKSGLTLKLPQQFTFETGFSLGHANNRNEALYYKQTGTDPWQPDNYQTNSFNYRENIYAGYTQLSKTWRGITFKTGLRYENTNIAGHQLVPADTSFAIRRADFFPYFYIRRSLFKILGYPITGNAIWRRSITRPGYDALSPYPKFVDPYTFEVGNTRLQPQFTTNYELNATFNDFPVFALGINDTKDMFNRVTYQNPTTKIAYRSYDNLGRNKEIYGRLFGGLPQGHKYFMYAGVQYNYIQYDGTYEGLPLHYNRGSWTWFTGHEFKATPTLTFNMNAWMYSNGFRAFYELKKMGQINCSVTKAAFKRKLSIILFGNDILKTNKSVFHLQQGTVLADGSRVQDSRRFGITLRYNYGIAHKEERKPAFTQPDMTEGNNN